MFLVLQHASNLEQKQNETENKKVHGDVVKYGTVMQVKDSFMCFYRRTNMSVVTRQTFTHRTQPNSRE